MSDGLAVISNVDKELRSAMLEAQQQVFSWVTEQKQLADTVALKGQHMLATDKENIEQLREDIEGVSSADEALQQRAREERQQVDKLRGDLERLTGQESRLPPEAERLAQQLSQGRTLVAQREASCEAAVSKKDHGLAELDKGSTMYKQRLGLQFERVGDERLRLTFTNIDANDPMRPYAFQVFVDGGDKYHVESCDPPVQGMDELITQLNTNNDFAAFVRAMRKRFKALV